jgi:hypothetical protein
VVFELQDERPVLETLSDCAILRRNSRQDEFEPVGFFFKSATFASFLIEPGIESRICAALRLFP